MHDISAQIYGGFSSLRLKFLHCLMKTAFLGAHARLSRRKKLLFLQQSSLGGREAGGWWRAQQAAFLFPQSRLPLLFKMKGDNWVV